MAKRLFVAGLPWSTDDSQLADAFSKFGKVNSATVIIDRETQRSKGFGFVEMDNDDEAEKAKSELNGSKMGEREIIVNDARPMEDRGERRNDRPRGNFGSDRRRFDNRGGGGSGGFRRGDRNDRGDRRGNRGR